MIKWLFWIAVAAVLTFGGWYLKDSYSESMGRFFMSMGWLLSGFLLILYAHKNLKDSDTKNKNI